MNKNKLGFAITATTLSAMMLVGCGGSSSGNDDQDQSTEVTRAHDERTFPINEQSLTDFMNNVPTTESGVAPTQDVLDADRFSGSYPGIQGESGYVAEIPEDWNGRLIMWAHGYSADLELAASPPSMAFRNTVLANGYAWAASTYSADLYDVRAAIEDTNRLALEFDQIIEADHPSVGDLPDVTQRLIAGGSLGGHTTAAAVEQETLDYARYPVEYEGAMALCQAEQNQFDWLGDYARVAQELAGQGDEPHANFQDLRDLIEAELFVFSGGANTWQVQAGAGEQLKGIAKRLTGGERPVFEQGFVYGGGALQEIVLDTGGSDGTINGILARNFYDNSDREYRWTDGPITTEEEEFNASIERVQADPGVNPLREDGVRWLPLVKGDVIVGDDGHPVPVLTMHTLGDFYVPFRHQQLYREKVEANGGGQYLVQRAIRAAGHCDFSAAEIASATEDFLGWVNDDVVPDGDDVMDPSDAAFGCDHTEDDNQETARRFMSIPACT